MKNQALFSSKDKVKKMKCHLLPILFGALRVKAPEMKTAKFKNCWDPDEEAHNELPHLDLNYLLATL